jgi:hypothetical protein
MLTVCLCFVFLIIYVDYEWMNVPNYNFPCDKFSKPRDGLSVLYSVHQYYYDSDISGSCGHIAQNIL